MKGSGRSICNRTLDATKHKRKETIHATHKETIHEKVWNVFDIFLSGVTNFRSTIYDKFHLDNFSKARAISLAEK